MSNPKTVLIAVDVQYDYLAGGVIEVPDGDDVVAPLVEVAKGVDLVIATRDWFPKDFDLFTKDFPPHCIQKTKGAKIHPQIIKVADLTVSKHTERLCFSAFDGGTLRPAKSLEEILKSQGIQRVLVGGLTLDGTVRYTALDANALGYETIVPLNCAASYDDEMRRVALASFQRAGVRTVPHWSPDE